MKRFGHLAVLLIAMALLGAKYLITQDAALVSGALASLKFESAPGQPGVIGGPPKMKVTKKTLAYLEKLLKEGNVIEVENNGAVKILDAKK